MKKVPWGFTLLEIMIVAVILGILVTLGLHNYRASREQAFDKEAQANLRLILAAERIWRMESNNNTYYASASIININNNLKLSLPTANNRNWNYTTMGTTTCCAQATRVLPPVRTWRLRNTENDPVLGTCP